MDSDLPEMVEAPQEVIVLGCNATKGSQLPIRTQQRPPAEAIRARLAVVQAAVA